MMVVRVETLDPCNPTEPLLAHVIVSATIGGALNSVALDLRDNAQFKVTVISAEAIVITEQEG